MENHTYNSSQEEESEDMRRQETRIDIGLSFPKWKSLMRDKCLQTDAEVASFLLFSYETSLTTKNGKPFQVSAPAESTIGASGGTDRMEWADEGSSYLHDHPADEEPPEEPSPCDQAPAFPGPQQLLCEDDVIGARASIVYEDCLRQLATFLILPVEKCSGLLKNGVVCNCVAPFDINITSEGTAMSVEWMCPNGHSLWRWNSQPVMTFGMQAGDFLLSTNILLSGNNYSKVALLFRFMNMGMVKKKSFLSIQDSYCVDTVKDFWEERRTEADGYISELQARIVKRRITSEVEKSRRCGPDDTRGPATSEFVPPQVRRGRAVPADVQKMLAIKEEISPEWRASLDQEDPETANVKEEEEELWISQEGEQLNGPEEADISRSPFMAVTVKSEEDEEKPQTSQLQSQSEPPASSSDTQIKTETDEEDCGGSEATRDLHPDHHLEPNTDEKASDSSETEGSNDEWQEPLSDCEPENQDSDSSFQRHMMRSSNCLIKVKQKVDSHMRIQTGEKPFECNFCGKRFNQQSHIKRHIGVHIGEKPFVCDVCGTRFNQQTHLDRHMRVHTGEKPFCCEICGLRFTQQTHLKRHTRVHIGDKPFGCDVCGTRFYQKIDLKTHIRVHTGEKPFGCDVCAKRFNRKTDLQIHMRVHTGEKPYGCDVCQKRFKHQTDLKRHTRVHTGEKPFGCDVCGKSFNRNANLKTHMRVHTGEKPFGCNVCGKTFTQQGSLEKHMMSHRI